MVLLLGRSLGIRRWLSLIFLTLGISIVTLSSSSNSRNLSFEIFDLSDHFFPRSVHELGQIADDTVVPAPGDLSSPLTRRSATYEGILEDQELVPRMNYSLGVTAVLVAAIVSGLTGVYFEKLLKEPTKTVSIWTRNVQLAFYSLFPALIVGVIITDGKEISKHGFFDGYNWVVWTAIVLQAVGGLLTSLCINYADNIAKNFATSISIVIGFIASVGVFGVRVTSGVDFLSL
jgi:UDP-galactose transporter